MNFLAHIYLSGSNPKIILGNFIGDLVKGKQLEKYDPIIQKGILLHRSIDYFTDQHTKVLKSKELLRPEYRHYAAVIVDIFYDHFLASEWQQYSQQNLQSFTHGFYELMDQHKDDMPEKGRFILKHMRRSNWLYHYQSLEGIDRALKGMSNRTRFDSGMEHAIHNLKKDYEIFQEHFHDFFPDLIQHCQQFRRRENF